MVVNASIIRFQRPSRHFDLAAEKAKLRATRQNGRPKQVMGAIARRLERLPVNLLGEIAYPVTEWMERIADRIRAVSVSRPSAWRNSDHAQRGA